MRYLLIALLLAASSSASAQAYVIGGFGRADADVNGPLSKPGGNAFNLGAGYRFSRNLSAEASAVYFKAKAQEVVGAGPAAIVTSESSRVTALGLAAIGELPLGAFALVGKAGISAVRHAFNVERTGAATITETDTSLVPVLGVGAQYNADGASFRLMLERINGKGALDSARLLHFQVLVPF